LRGRPSSEAIAGYRNDAGGADAFELATSCATWCAGRGGRRRWRPGFGRGMYFAWQVALRGGRQQALILRWIRGSKGREACRAKSQVCARIDWGVIAFAVGVRQGDGLCAGARRGRLRKWRGRSGKSRRRPREREWGAMAPLPKRDGYRGNEASAASRSSKIG
jgi:hypothetical protein